MPAYLDTSILISKTFDKSQNEFVWDERKRMCVVLKFSWLDYCNSLSLPEGGQGSSNGFPSCHVFKKYSYLLLTHVEMYIFESIT